MKEQSDTFDNRLKHIEDSLRKIVSRQQPKKQNVLDIIKTLPKPTGNTEIYSTENYLEENKTKYGF
jgi:hypothetical protein